VTDKRAEVNAKMAIAQALLGKTTGASKGYQPPPDPKTKVRPMGGLKPHGVRMTWEKKF
jgi:hypothetical protein